MIEFRWSKVDKKNNNTPILKDAEIDELAEMVMHDYKPQLLKDPAPIDHLHFLEFYLGANVRFMDIYYDEKPIWGATAFNDEEYIRVFDRENTCIRAEKLNNRTIVIDNYVMQEGKEGLALFTCLHEGGHLWLHPGVYTKPSDQLSLFPEPGKEYVVCCRQEDIQSFGRRKNFKTAKEWREHHADYFASAFAMPKSTFIPLALEILKSEGISGGRVVTGVDFQHDWFAENVFPKRISEIYGVSKQAAYIKLRKFGFIIAKSDVGVTLF